MENQQKRYNGKTSLLVTYHYEDDAHDAIIVSQTFDTFDEAFSKMVRVMPNDIRPDDGYDVACWGENPDTEEMFDQYCSNTGNGTYFLAVLSPVANEEGCEQ